MIEVVNLHVKYRWRQEPVIRDVHARFKDKHLILGPNGSGKTTLFRAIAGLTPISSGRIIIDGVNLDEIYGKPGVLAINLSEVYNVFHLNAYDHLRLFMDLTGGDFDLALKMLGDLGLSTDLLRKRKPWELSAGQQKAFSTVIALLSSARHILLDEPFEQLDPARKGKLIEHLREHKGVILLNTHETWLLSALKDWSTHLMFEGKLCGSMSAGELVEASLVVGDSADAMLRFTVSGKTYSLVRGEGGEPLSNLITLDRIYELTLS
ncbi:hypothetical protein DRO55_01395 [Candidatus Bathyarchaeota archaeon]|nr:MAG: hypothetical protein DRO55_01395 [Candidatus Bathyarchaeota archaeon]